MDVRAFELSLLRRMTAGIRDRVLRAYGVTPEQATSIAAECPIQLPDRGIARVDDYARVIGHPVRQRSVPLIQPPFVGLTEHAFILPSWPHLFWVVHEMSNGLSAYIGFHNQHDIPRHALTPMLFAPEQLTLPVVSQAATKDQYEDGWEEQLVRHLQFGDDKYEAEFVWGLLQHCKKL